MRFLPKETCEKLVKMGVRSESTFCYLKDDGIIYSSARSFRGDPPDDETPAFILSDFVETDSFAKENCKRLWGIDMKKDGSYWWNHACYAMRHKILDSDDWVEFIKVEVEKHG